MFALVSEDHAMFVENGTAAITIAVAISLGFVAVAVANKYLNRYLAFRKQRIAEIQAHKQKSRQVNNLTRV